MKNATGSALYATPMCVLARLFEFAMNATMDPFRDAVLFAEGLEFLMHTIARNARSRRKTGMVVQKLSIWGVPKQTCSMSAKNMDLRRDDGIDLSSPSQKLVSTIIML